MRTQLVQAIKRTPLLGAVATRAVRLVRRSLFAGTVNYWETRYAEGGSSGAGSAGELARFKAEVLNGLVESHGVRSVLELGCGDGGQLALARYPEYIGLDVARTAIDLCRRRYADDAHKSFFLYDPSAFVDRHRVFHADMTLSLDVIYHLIEDDLFATHIRHLFGAADRFVVIYSSDTDANPHPGAHVRHRRFTLWVEAHVPEFRLRERIPNRFPFAGDDRTGSVSDFFVYERRT